MARSGDGRSGLRVGVRDVRPSVFARQNGAKAPYREYYPAIIEESFECDHANTLVAEEVPLDLSIFDDRLVIPWFEPNTGTVSVLFDSDDPDAMAWGEAVFEACRKDAMVVEKDSI